MTNSEKNCIKQQTDEWHSLRAKGIGSSDAPVIMNVSSYATPLQLWEEKTGLMKRDDSTNFIQQKGHDSEVRMRAIYELERGFQVPPALIQHETYPFIRASLDGYNKEKGVAVEFKLVGKKDFENAQAGTIKESHMVQMDHMLLILGIDHIDYVCTDGARRCNVPHLADVGRAKKLLSAEIEFWKCVEFGEPPPLTDRDFQKIQDKDLTKKIREWKRAKLRFDSAEELEKKLRKEIIGSCGEHPRMRGAGVRIQQSWRKGAVEYGKIAELAGVDLEKYRKPMSCSWQIKMEKDA